MSITKSYNKHTDTYYAYETTYEWDEKRQKKVQKKVCIGKYDSATGEIIPNARRGRPAKFEPADHLSLGLVNRAPVLHAAQEWIFPEIEEIVSEMAAIHSELEHLSERFALLEDKLHALQATSSSDDN